MPTNINDIKRWLLKKLSGTIDETEEAKLRQWMDESPENKAFTHHILSAPFLKRAITDRNEPQRERSWNALRHKLGYVRFPHIGRWYSAAAAVVLIAACGWMASYYISVYRDAHYVAETIPSGSTKAILYDYANDSVFRLPETAGLVFDLSTYNRLMPAKTQAKASRMSRKIVVPRGGEYLIRLSDSTAIHLGPESSLDIPLDYSGENRAVTLTGQAYLSVHSDAEHPFIIHTPDVDVRVLGTRLNIESYPDETHTLVSLEEGKAELQAGDNRFFLPKGRTAAVSADKNIALTTDSIAERTSWHNSRLVFYNRSMADIMRHVARWYNVEVEFDTDEAASSRITMDVDKYETLNQLINDIEKMNELQIKIKQKNRVLISERSLD